MKIYSHRVNTISALEKVEPSYGVEIDLRTKGGNLILSHDPFAEGELFSEWLKYWRGQSLILNVKEDALENSILQYLNFTIPPQIFPSFSPPFFHPN